MRARAFIAVLVLILTITLYWHPWNLEGDFWGSSDAAPQSGPDNADASGALRRATDGADMTDPAEPVAIALPPNDTPPDPELLAGRPELQEAFDEAAAPGEFVTPPNVATGDD